MIIGVGRPVRATASTPAGLWFLVGVVGTGCDEYMNHRANHVRERGLLLPWIVAVGAGESVGFLAPASAGVISADGPPIAQAVALLTGGVLEGAVLGIAQAWVLRRVLPALDSRRWIGLTAGAALVAYAIALATISTVGPAPVLAKIIICTVGGLLLLVSIGSAQWLELRNHVDRAGVWIIWTAVAWLPALGVFFAIATPLWHAGQPIVISVLIGAVAGTAMAFVQAAITGVGLQRLVTNVPGLVGS